MLARGLHWLVLILPGTAVPHPGGVTYLLYVLGHAGPSDLDEEATTTHTFLPYVLGHACLLVLDEEAATTTTVEHAQPTYGRSLQNFEY